MKLAGQEVAAVLQEADDNLPHPCQCARRKATRRSTFQVSALGRLAYQVCC